MDEESIKRNTDCVYFLASPLTCKKGLECEYRHSESARLNPRDCWYWVSGGCRNPTCAFRHPPLDGRPETSSESASLPNQAPAPAPAPVPVPVPVPVTKSNVPCYFYFSGFCNKGDSCSFMHGPNGVLPAWQTSKTTSAAASVHLENKTVARSDRVSASTDAPPKLAETKMKEENIQVESKVELPPSVSTSYALQRSPSLQPPMPEFEEAVVKSGIQLPAGDFIDETSLLCGDQSSEDQGDDHIEPEERWESSPGFDVLVDDGSENMGYEDDREYLLARGTEVGGLHDHMLQYDYDNPVGYDHEYPDSSVLYDGRYAPYDLLENDHIPDYVQRLPKRSREMSPDPMFQRGNLPSREMGVGERKDVDLRDHLKKRRKITGRPRRRGASHFNDGRQEEHGRRNGRQPPHRRLTSEVGSSMIGGVHREEETRPSDNYRQGGSRHSQPPPRRAGSRLHERERRRQARQQFKSAEISKGGMASHETRRSEEPITFSGPKTLAQIKEEKRKARQNEESSTSKSHHHSRTHHNSRTASENFEGPKPLSEILKEKKKHGSASDDNASHIRKHDHKELERSRIPFDEDKNGFLHEDEEDDDDFKEKLAGIMCG